MGFSKNESGRKIDWETAALAGLFGVVFIAFWAIITPNGSFADDIYTMGHVRYLIENASIPAHQINLHYFDFPGLHLLGAAITEILGLTVFQGRMFFMIFNSMLFGTLLYILFVKLLGRNRLAFVCVALVVMGSAYLVEQMRIFTPGILGFTLVLGFFSILTKSEGNLFGKTVLDRLLMIILFAAMVISYLPTSFMAPLILLGVYLLLRSGSGREALSPMTIALLLVMVIAWEIYGTYYTFNSFATFMPKLWSDISQGGFLTYFRILSPANVGGRLPLWANVTRLFWWGLLGLGTAIGLYYIFKIKEKTLLHKIMTGGLLGVIALTVIGMFGQQGGIQFTRYLLYAPLFCSPILLTFLSGGGIWRRRSLVLVTVLIFVLCLPTFLSSINSVSTDAIYSDETAAGSFLENTTSVGNGTSYYLYSPASGAAVPWVSYYTPDYPEMVIPEQTFYSGSADEYWRQAYSLIDDFKVGFAPPGTQKVLLYSEKTPEAVEHLWAISPSDPKWGQLIGYLSDTDMIYNNGHIQMYVPS
jgi:hypothetical protein